MSLKRNYRSFDIILVLVVCAVCVFGIIAIGSATHVNLGVVSTEYNNQKIWFGTGIVFMLVAAFVDYHFISKFYIPLYILNILLLVLVFYLDRDPDSPSRWIRFGGGGAIGIQPAEFCKIFIIIYMAKFIDKKNEKINNIFVLLFILFCAALPSVLIILQPSLSVGLCVAAIAIIILYAGNISYKYVLVAAILIVPAMLLIVYDLGREEHLFVDIILTDYQMSRFLPDNQIKQSMHAIGSGMFNGKGIYQGTINQYGYLPENHNDFIFALIGEEFGFVGCVTLLLVMLFIIIKCLITAHKAADLLGKLIATGVAGMLAFQTFVNVGVSAGILPNTGITFPFVSSGGSSMWISMIAIGLVLNVGMSKPKSIFEG